MTIELSAYFDGEHILLDEPFELQPNTKLIVTVLPKQDDERESWNRLAITGLKAAYDEDEEDYSLDSIKQANSDYAGG